MNRQHDIPQLSASFVCWHTDPQELAACLEMTARAEVGAVYVVDNAREQAIADVCTNFKGVEYIPSDNRGYGAGHNIAIRRAMASGADYHLVSNTDISCDPAALRRLTAYMEAHRDVVLAHPRITGEDGCEQYTARRLPDPFDLIIRRFTPSWFMPRRRAVYLLKHSDKRKPLNVPYVQGSFMLMRTDALKEVGLFDERFFMYPEDIDLTRRLHAFGRTMYVPGATVVHRHRQASRRSARLLSVHIFNMISYFNKWGWFSDPQRKLFNSRLEARISSQRESAK